MCEAVERVTDAISTWVLAPRDGRSVNFHAGQYVTVEFDVGGQSVMRCYTISSPPTRPTRIAITAKRVPGGAITPWLHAGGLAPGGQVRVGEPQGSFVLDAHPAPAYALLTAGSGITPALSILRDLADRSAALDVVLVHSESRASDIPYRSELDTLSGRVPGLVIHYLCRESGPQVTVGRLNADRLAALVPDLAARAVLICGPQGYRETVRSVAASLGVAADRLHEESFVFEETTAGVRRGRRASLVPEDLTAGDGVAVSRASGMSHRVEFRTAGVTIEVPAGMTVLDAAIAAGLTPPMSCTEGMCGTCKTDLLEGDVEMNHQGGIRPREIAAGKILPCCSRPLTDLVLA